MKSILLTVIVVLALAAASFAQSADVATLDKSTTSSSLGIKPAVNPFSLLDLSRIKWSNSYSVSYFSGGYGAGGAGLLQTNMLYEFSPKFSMGLSLGVVHSLGGLAGGISSQPNILPGIRLDYHPSEKFRMTLDVQRVSGLFYPFPGSYGYWSSPFFGH